ncbi:type II toxin-antitoxin system YafQ family toxin [Hoylesella loescheii]|jgi:addiction module toxin component yafQ|uniref:Toxin-antitoxin system, toxin component, RelE domain protein n=1 Tax=Hoylesella loescheii DSM 19665 = JCM 12249 = ATCC 15930 TaxID=1122985 RepID=A0A069QIP0_HOYLO|nr:type II toxin-antitoxin system YafQ family toxin [Hoylesella loescheii]KDR52655.1 toxin-antitoxin system, toxin component, RelE domain protein [Hoylesella loescheii DSM 19665 = JCM 12249 = ATCC 15930]
MREIVYTGQYKRDLKRARKRQMPEDDPNEVIRLLAENQPLPLERRGHGTFW